MQLLLLVVLTVLIIALIAAFVVFSMKKSEGFAGEFNNFKIYQDWRTRQTFPVRGNNDYFYFYRHLPNPTPVYPIRAE